jgi:hypothetical protein
MFAVTPAVATASRQWLKSSGLITVVRATFHLCPLMRIREAFRYLWPGDTFIESPFPACLSAAFGIPAGRGVAPGTPAREPGPHGPPPFVRPAASGSLCRAARVLNCQRFGESSRISAKPGSRRCPPSLSRKCRDLLGLAASCLNTTGFCRRLGSGARVASCAVVVTR